MNILWLSVAPFAPTGYGTQTAQATRRLRDAGHNVAISVQAGLQWGKMEWDGIPLYPADHTRLNKRMLRHQAEDFAEKCGCSPAEIQVISLFDIWPWVDRNMGGMVADFKGMNIAAWLPVDSMPVSPKTCASLRTFDVTPIAMSRFGEQQLRESGFDPLYVPHGIDTNAYAPRTDRDRCKQIMGIDPEQFVVGMVAHNEGLQPARKAFPNVLQAFSAFQRDHDDAVLYLHTEPTGRAWNGLDLLGMASMFGIPESALAIVPQIPYLSGDIAPVGMSHIYSAMDVLANPSYCEGFGLPIVEAQACGTPVVVTAFSSMPELVGAGWTVGGTPWFNEAAGAMWMHPSTEEILAAFEAAYERRGDTGLREQAREFAVGYDADKVFAENWVPALETLGRPREVPPLPFAPNREQRRALGKETARQIRETFEKAKA
jgi:glycosyltransferase involved in cell wall biosynthesis